MKLNISRDGVEIGEWTEEEVRAFYKEGRLVSSDGYWMPGMTEWGTLVTFANPPPPFPEPAIASLPPLPQSPKPMAIAERPKRKLYPSTPATKGDILIPVALAEVCGIFLVAYEELHAHGSLTDDLFTLLVVGFARSLAALVIGLLLSLLAPRPARLFISLGFIVSLSIYGAVLISGEKAFHPMTAEQWKAQEDQIKADAIRRVLQQDMKPSSTTTNN